MSGNNVSHSKRRTKRVFRPNLQRVRAMVGKSPVILKGMHALLAQRARAQARQA